MREIWKRKKMERPIDRLTVHTAENGVVYLSFPLLDQFDFLKNAFSTRLGGVSEGDTASMNFSSARDSSREHVLTNYRLFAEAVGFDPQDLVFSDQTHTDRVIRVSRQDATGVFDPAGERKGPCDSFHDVDGLITNDPGAVLMTFYADCVPLLLADPIRRAVASVHSGWRGTVKDIAGKTVAKMRECFGSRPEDLYAAIGPSICQDCYEVGEEVARHIQEAFPRRLWPDLLREGETREEKGSDGEMRLTAHFQLNLQEACRQNFLRAGILPEHISVPDLCTSCNGDLLFSHRKSHGKRGTLAAVIQILPKNDKV